MRRNHLGKEDLVNIEWKTGHINHTVQEDATSCGVFVLQVLLCTIHRPTRSMIGFPDAIDICLTHKSSAFS